MLTIREPIRLKTGHPIQGMRQDMAARIEANYGLMNLAIRKEELLHITSQPAEIYFADSENFQILTNINNQNKQEVRLEVINNLMNRILVAQTENFTYQDTVYISNVLRKLGIRDEKTFMKQVFELQNEHRETKQLLQSYEKNQEVLKQLLKIEGETRQPEIKEQQSIIERERRYYIHDEIFRRLETGKIYQDMRQFSKNYLHESIQINPGEMQVAEQTKLSDNFTLQNIKNEISGNTNPIYYLHNNRYEYLQEITEVTSQSLEEQITAAILLNLAEQSFVLRQNQIEENSHYWYSIVNSLFQTSENTWKRYENNLTERRLFTSRMSQFFEEVHEEKQLENNLVHNIVEEYYRNLQLWKEQNEINNHTLNWVNIQEAPRQEIYFSGGSYHLTEEEFRMNFFKEEDGETEEFENKITTEQLQKQLELYNQRNFENYKKITEIEKQQIKVKDRRVNRHKAQMDALRALENPEEVLIEYLSDNSKDSLEEMKDKVGAQIYELFSEETKEIYRQFLTQNTSEHTTFLEHIMKQPHEEKIRQEVVEVLERLEKQEEVVKSKRERIESVQQQQFTVGQELKERVFQEVVLWRKIQEQPILEQKDILYLQNEIKDEIYTQQIEKKNLFQETKTEKYVNSTNIDGVNEIIQTQLTYLKENQEYPVLEQKDEIYHQNASRDEIYTQQVEKKNLFQETKTEKHVNSTNIDGVNEIIQTQLTYLKENQEYPVLEQKDEIYHQNISRDEIYTQETEKKNIVHDIETEKYFNSKSIQGVNEITQTQLTYLKENQEYPMLEQKEEIYLQNENRDEIYVRETEKKSIVHDIEVEKYFNSRQMERVNEVTQAQLTLLKDNKEREDVFYPEIEYAQERTEKILQTREIEYTDLKENVERKIKRQQENLTVVNSAVQKEIRRQQVELVHKVDEQLVKEELLEEIRQQNQNTVKTVQTEETSVQNHREIQQIVQDSINKIQVNRVDNIEEMVQQSVKRQLNNLSDQVYGKLEKKLQTERKRRGYF